MSNWYDGLDEVKVIGMDGKTEITIDINKILHVDAGNLLEESANLSRYYAYIANLACESERRTEQFKVMANNKIAEISKGIREQNTDKRVTKDMMTEMIDTDTNVLKIRKEIIRRETETKKLFRVSKAIELKDRSIQNLTKILQSEWFMEFNRDKDSAISKFINTGKYEQYLADKQTTDTETEEN